MLEYMCIENLSVVDKVFDGDGFVKDGSGWVLYNYKFFLSIFWLINGLIGDVMIRFFESF